MANLLFNPDYENSSTIASEILAYFSCPFSIDTTFSFSNSQSMKMVTNSASNTQGLIHMVPATGVLPSGAIVPISSTWLWVPTGITVAIGNRIQGHAGAQLTESTVSTSIIGNNNWQQVFLPSWTFTGDPLGFKPGIQARVSPATTGITFWMDNSYIGSPPQTVNDIPVSTIDEQALTNPPFTIDNTLVNDTVALVDDPTALSGGQITISPLLKSSITDTPPRSKISIFR